MSEPMHCEIVTPVTSMYSATAEFVVLPGKDGDMGIYAKHSPVITTLRPGLVKVYVEEGGEEIDVAVSRGFAEVDGENVVVLADRALRIEDIDVERARKSLERHEAELAELAEDDPGRSYIENKIIWVKLLLHVKEA